MGCGRTRALHVLFKDERFALVLFAHPAFLAVEVALPEDVRKAHRENRRQSGRDLEEEDVVENRKLAGLGRSGGRAAQEHHGGGARRDEHGADRLLVEAECGERGSHQGETEDAKPTADVITIETALPSRKATNTSTYGFLMMESGLIAMLTKASFAPMCVM